MLDVSHANCLHDLADGHVPRRRHQQVNVIGHEDIGVHFAAVPLASRPETVSEEAVVRVVCEERRAIVASLRDMLRYPSRAKAWRAWQASSFRSFMEWSRQTH